MVADKFPNGLIGPIGLRIIRTIRRGYHSPILSILPILPILPINSTSISTTKFVVRRAPSATLGKNATDG